MENATQDNRKITMRPPTKYEANILLRRYDIEIIGDIYGWDYEKTALKFPDVNEFVYRSPESVFLQYSLHESLSEIRNYDMEKAFAQAGIGRPPKIPSGSVPLI